MKTWVECSNDEKIERLQEEAASQAKEAEQFRDDAHECEAYIAKIRAKIKEIGSAQPGQEIKPVNF